uniref:Uncharacterized protein n=1 Tax=Vespula pensylvanica TaxID=30213 RepID=A0A834N117_VESPE|nr:hypothetical protein H0235_017476 [Vespula pensylvanica]
MPMDLNKVKHNNNTPIITNKPLISMAERTFSIPITLGIPTSNRFLSIVTPEYHETSENSTPDKIPSSPAIFLEEVLDMQSMISLLEKVVKKENYSLKANNDKVKILPKNVDAYKKIVKQLKKANARFHIYQFKQDRTFKVVLHNIHHLANMVELKDELLLLGYEILNISNVNHNKTLQSFSPFFIDLKQKQNNKEIY